MIFENSFLNLQKYDFNNSTFFSHYYFHFFAYSTIIFFVPFLIGHPQLLVGSIVNAALFLAALNMKFRETLPLIVLPSLAVLSRGLIFGPFTKFLLIMIPFIWLGNSLLVYLFKYIHLEKKINSVISMMIVSSAKALFLFIIAFFLYKLAVLPIIFLTVMGLLQLYTALMGGVIALGIQKVMSKD